MKINRRFFLSSGMAALTGAALSAKTPAGAQDSPNPSNTNEKSNVESGENHVQVSCLVDTTLCIGCRKCEEACNRRNHMPKPDLPFSDKTVFRSLRHPNPNAMTVVNQFPGSPSPDQPAIRETHCKIQCMHCLNPACVSACIVGALMKANDGSVIYNPDICIGCRYCMIACPFDIPAYEFDEPVTPRVVKCEFCTDRATKTGANPACAAACPTETLVFGTREKILELAAHRLKERPDRYINHIYGEKEVGGAAWLYLTGRPHTELNLKTFPEQAPPVLTETIQHTVYKYGAIPLALYGLLFSVMWRLRRKGEKSGGKSHSDRGTADPGSHDPHPEPPKGERT